MLKLNQARSEGWTLVPNPVRIVSTDPLTHSDQSMRARVFNEIMAGSAYHIEAFDIVRTQNVDAIALIPDVTIGSWVRITEPVMVTETRTTQVPNPDYGSTTEPDDVLEFLDSEEVVEVTKPVGTAGLITGRSPSVRDISAQFTVTFPGGGVAVYDEKDDTWFPFQKLQTIAVYGNYGTLTADATTGAVLELAESNDADDQDNYRDIALVDVAELKSTFGELPGTIDIILVGYTTKDGTRERPERDDWLKVRIDNLEDKTFAAVLYARLGLTK